ncbi:MAG TPA: DUF4838 domain-containing protein [Candidatus Hydrogenedentes bacterium]|nr:DUF4838 domain-containing protein [Candidatus Hydrogenedentota bacterium]HPG69427.1 DUF4838 domain-containing protein [Candidatus Hydrogenedentota bacterium]
MLRFTVVGAILVAATAVSFAAPFTLATGGRPAATIVIPKEADAFVRTASEDLCHYVESICGVKLPFSEAGAAVSGPAVYVGACATTMESDRPPADSHPEAYAVRVRDGNLFLTGRHSPATAFAVVSFIERELGVRWYAPGELWEYVPRSTAGELSVDVAPRVVVPDWSPRVWSGHAWTDSWNRWLLRNKAICEPPVPFRNMQNHIYQVFAPEKYAERHPEYYPLINGKRWIPSPDDHAWRPCESNPDVVRITVEAARAYLDEHPEHNSFSLAMDDITHLCGCESCRAWDAHPDDYEKRHFSDRHYRFVNAVARELAKTHPDRFIGTLCYHIARELPETVPELEPNVFISMTQCCAQWWRPGLKEEDMELTRQWRARSTHMSRYDYMGLGFLTPRVFPHAIAEAMKFDHGLGFEGVYNECYVILPNAAPMMWMVAKLQWDTDLAADALLDEFYACMFGASAATMKAYFDLLEKSWMTPRPGRLTWGHRDLVSQSNAMAVEDVEAAEGLLAKAASETKDADALRRIDVVAAALRYGAYIIRAGALSKGLRVGQIKTPDQARDALARMGAVDTLRREREAFWAEAVERDDLLGETLRGLKGRQYFVANQIGNVEAAGSSVMIGALDTLYAHSKKEAARAVAALGNGDTGTQGALARAWLAVRRDAVGNRLQNPGFEVVSENGQAAEGNEQTTTAPPGWSTWDNGAGATEFRSLAEGGRDGSRAAAIVGADSACYLQGVPVEPGALYLCLVWARQLRSLGEGGGLLGVRWRTADGQWHGDHSVEPTVALSQPTLTWQPLGLIAVAPEGAKELVFMLSAKNQEAAGGVAFDEAGLYDLPKGE